VIILSNQLLQSTSGYGKAAFDFAANKPMELLGGSNLLYLLKEHAGIEARIVMPDDWHDPAFDV
jgi:restriction system protein